MVNESDSFFDIVFASDSNYIQYTAVALASVLKNYKGTRKIRIFLLLDKELSDNDRRAFEALSSIHPYQLHQIEVNASNFAGIRTTDGISIATYYRLVMHHLLPQDCRRVVYLDSDLIVLDSLDKILAEVSDYFLFHGVEDSISREYNKRGGMPDGSPHINAGVLLVNVAKMRAIPFDQIVNSYIEKNRYRIFLGDQQIISECFPHDIKYIHARWNVHGPLFDSDWVARHCGVSNHHNAADIARAAAAPAIVHYTLKRKPWMSLDHPFARVWYDYLALTPYRDQISMPTQDTNETRTQAAPNHVFGRNVASRSPLRKTIAGWIKSVAQLRKTRLTVERLEQYLLMTRADSATPSDAPSIRQVRHIPQRVLLKHYLTSMAARRPCTFDATEFARTTRPNLTVLSNAERKNLDGGYAELIKQVLRTNAIGQSEQADLILFLSQRLEQDIFWHCVENAYLRDLPVLFAEVALFAGYASFFDNNATLAERRALGFIVDDMGYYFDSSQPSRVEHELNRPDFSLTEAQHTEARRLINKICTHGITKYNKYARLPHRFPIEDDCVLVLDQKKGDASIEFSGATDDSFRLMMEAAIQENPNRRIYFKRHPDSILRNFNSYRNRNIKEIKVLPDNVPIIDVLDRCHAVYTVSSQVGFEALLRGKRVVCFGNPFYAGWGLTDDRLPCPRRVQKRTIEDIFYQTCIKQSVYVDPETGNLTTLESTIDAILRMRDHFSLAA